MKIYLLFFLDSWQISVFLAVEIEGIKFLNKNKIRSN